MARRGRGACLYWRSDNKVYEIIYNNSGRRIRKSTGTSDRARAEEQLAQFIITIGETGSDRPSHSYQRLLGDSLASYATEQAVNTARPKETLKYIETLIEFWGDMFADTVKKTTCQAYCKWRREVYSRKHKGKKEISDETLRRELSVLSAAIGHDAAEGRLLERPYVWLPERKPAKDRWLTRTEVAKLLIAARKSKSPVLTQFIRIALYTAARKDAILGLRWNQVDLEHGLINFNEPGRAVTNKRRAHNPIPSRIMPLLRALRERGTDIGYVIHIDQSRVGDIKRGFSTAVKLAGMTRVTPHTLRHTAATWMIRDGVDILKVSRYLGHTEVRITEQTYAHHSPEYLKDAARSFSRRRDSATDSATVKSGKAD